MDKLMAEVGGLAFANVIGHGFGEHGHGLEADALALQVVANLVCIGQWSIYSVDDTIEHIIVEHTVRPVVNEAANLILVAIQFVICASATVVQFGDAVEVYSIPFLALFEKMCYNIQREYLYKYF